MRHPGKEPMQEPMVVEIAQRAHMAPIKVDAKIELPVYNGEINGEKVDEWLDQLESYYALYEYDDAQRLAFARLKLVSHTLVWWNAHLPSRGTSRLMWEAFKGLLK